MSHTEEILPDKKLIVVRMEGKFDMEIMNQLAIHYRSMALEKGFGLICDLRKGSNKISIIEALRAVRKYDKGEYRKLRKVPVGVVAEGTQYIFFKVVEQFIANANGEIRIFKDLENAIKYFENRIRK